MYHSWYSQSSSVERDFKSPIHLCGNFPEELILHSSWALVSLLPKIFSFFLMFCLFVGKHFSLFQHWILNNNKKKIIFRSAISLIFYTFSWILPLIIVAVLLDFKKRFNSSSCSSRRYSKCCSSSSDSLNLRSVNKCSFSLR